MSQFRTPNGQRSEALETESFRTPQSLMSALLSGMTVKGAKQQIEEKNYDSALFQLREALFALCGEEMASKIPLSSKYGGGMQWDAYKQTEPGKLIFLMEFCSLFAECYHKMGQRFEALYWLTELHAIQRNISFQSPEGHMFDWRNFYYYNQTFFDSKVAGYKRETDIFLELGNTGAATHRRWQGCEKAVENLMNAEANVKYKHLEDLINTPSSLDLTTVRHPDPKLIQKLEIIDPRLQVRGSWQKIDVPKANSIPPRYGFSSFVWNSRLYVLAGQKTAMPGPWYRDFYYIDLTDLQGGWHTLPEYPIPAERSEIRLTNFQIEVDPRTDKAYFFLGRTTLDVFDLRTNKWSQIKTKMDSASGRWPVPSGYADYCMAIVRGKLYTFAGSMSGWALGGNLLMSLDLDTRIWTRLSGHPASDIVPDLMRPGPRKHAMMWVDKAEERLWIIYGEADRAGAKQLGQTMYESSESFVQHDCWSWDIANKKWRQERIVGNPPCPRAEAGITHNTVLDKVVMFGGYNAAVPTTYKEASKFFGFSYYADTFILDTAPEDGSAPHWRQILTSGFPTYRAQCKLFSDPLTGKIYMFGGYTNGEYIPNRGSVMSRSFNDLWQLKIDIPGGYFEDVNIEDELRTARAGPWQRCFACGNTGYGAGLKRCRGTCKGKVVFCDSSCQKHGWSAHKEMHRCSKS